MHMLKFYTNTNTEKIFYIFSLIVCFSLLALFQTCWRSQFLTTCVLINRCRILLVAMKRVNNIIWRYFNVQLFRRFHYNHSYHRKTVFCVLKRNFSNFLKIKKDWENNILANLIMMFLKCDRDAEYQRVL